MHSLARVPPTSVPTDPLRPLLLRFEIFSGYTIHILYYAGVSIMPPRVAGAIIETAHPQLVIVLTKAAPALFIKWSGEYFLK